MGDESVADYYNALREIEALKRERDEARKQVQFMVEKAASGGVLDGYRELGQKCAALEARCDEQANFIESAFKAHSNLDLDIAALQGEQG